MGRFSPTVLPTAASPFASALNEGFDSFMQERDRKRAQKFQDQQITAQRQREEDAHLAATTNAYTAGVRPGTAPVEQGTDVTDIAHPRTPAMPMPSSTDLAAGLRGDTSYQPPTPAAGPADFPAPDFASALRNGQGGQTPPMQRTPMAPPSEAPAPTLASPGSFNAATGTFGGGPPSPAARAIGMAVANSVHLGPIGRYIQVDPGHFVDTLATPGAARERAASAQQEHADKLQADRMEAEAARARETQGAIGARATAATTAKQQAGVTKARSEYQTLKAYYPNDPLATMAFDETNPADYAAALTHQRDIEKAKAAQPHLVPVLENGKTVYRPVTEAAGKEVAPHATSAREAPELTATRKDLKDAQSQQIRAEHDVSATKSDLRAFEAAHGSGRIAKDPALAKQHVDLQRAVTDAETRKKTMTSRADSIITVIGTSRAGGDGKSVVTPPTDDFTDAEVLGAHNAGARTDDEIRASILKTRKPKP